MLKYILLILFYFNSQTLFSCTTLLITKEATTDGSTIVAHSDDDDLGDQRLVYVPAKSYPKGSKRAIYPANVSTYPRYVGKDRGPAYNTSEYPFTKPLGYIDQVPHTYAYFDANYSVINEHQLAIGECTNSTYYYFDHSEDRLLDISALSRIALERCKQAKEAVKLIGALAEKHGYYGWGETLLLADPEEGWVFEISATPTGKSAVWVAKKVPEGEMFVAANQFRIQNIDPKDPNTLFSSSLFKIAKENNWLDENENFDWQKNLCPGEFDHPYYSLRRVWRVFSQVAPSKDLSPWVENAYTKEYPFSIKLDNKISVKDVFSLYRDHYEDTEFSLRKGLSSGPYGSPHRYLGNYDRCNFPNKRTTKPQGAWERPISVYYCGFSYVAQLRKDLPDAIGGLVWFSFDAPYTTCYMPLYAGMTDLPKNFQYGNPLKFNKDFAWWAFNFTANWIANKFDIAIKDLQDKQQEYETEMLKQQQKIELKAIQYYKKNPSDAKKYLTQYCINNANDIVNKWWDLSTYLIEKYNTGFINKPKPSSIGYPLWWREDVGYDKGPVSYEK
jgi:dipeptidase